MRKLLDKNFSLINSFRALLKNTGCNYYDLAYEDLYSEGVKVEDRVKIIDYILTRAGYSPSSTFDDGTLSRLHLQLDHTVKLNTTQTYRLIPNIDEIEEKFGSDEVGYLFR